MKKKQEAQQVSPHAFQVMRIGNMYRYRPLQVNNSLLIGSGPEGWHAYAVLATEERVGEIEKAIKGKVRS